MGYGVFLKIWEILMMMGTGIFLFGPKGAEKMEIKDFNMHSEIMSKSTFCVQRVTQNNRLCFVGP